LLAVILPTSSRAFFLLLSLYVYFEILFSIAFFDVNFPILAALAFEPFLSKPSLPLDRLARDLSFLTFADVLAAPTAP